MRGDLPPRVGNARHMLTRTRFCIDPEFGPLLSDHSLDSFDSLVASDPGDQVARKRQHEVRRLELPLADDGGSLTCYLRRSFGDSLRAAIKALVKGRMPHAACMREYLMIRKLQSFDLPVMKPIAWGERSKWALPHQSVLLVEAVPGRPATELLIDGDRQVRARLLRAAASLAGKLNLAGFFQPLRLRDMICTGFTADGEPGLVLIDRETNLARQRRITPARCCDFLARSYCKLLQAGIEPDMGQIRSCLRAYHVALAGARAPSVRHLYKDAARRVEQLTGPGKKYSGLRPAPGRPHE